MNPHPLYEILKCVYVYIYTVCSTFVIFTVQIRGAMNAVKKLLEDRCTDNSMRCSDGELRVVTHSSGNHAQALAFAAKKCGILAEVVMPSTSSQMKVQAVDGYGGSVTLCYPSEQVTDVTVYSVGKDFELWTSLDDLRIVLSIAPWMHAYMSVVLLLTSQHCSMDACIYVCCWRLSIAPWMHAYMSVVLLLTSKHCFMDACIYVCCFVVDI